MLMNAAETPRDILKANNLDHLTQYPNITKIVASVLTVWPEHKKYCQARFFQNDGDFLARMESIAEFVCIIVGKELNLYCADYRWMCEEFLKEELYFRRNNNYRLSSFGEAFDTIYGDDSYMSRYVRGILISQLIWMPHAQAIDHFRTVFLPILPEGSSYLEVGPGHGLFLYFAWKPGMSAIPVSPKREQPSTLSA
jgi:hypothetical protein